MGTIASAISPEVNMELETLRARQEVRPLTFEQEGMPLGLLPANVFGYTYSPLNASTPLFAKRTYQCFEVHKLGGENVNLLCFVTRAEADEILAGREIAELKLYPEPAGEATTLAEVAMARITKAKPLSRAGGNYMPVHLDSGD